MPSSHTTDANHLPPPAQWKNEARYLGYKESDAKKPYAHYFKDTPLPMQEHVQAALLEGMSPTEWGYPLSEAADQLQTPGYLKLETGWTRLADGSVLVSVLTKMPNVTPAMWDWWMAWHSVESARYKLWHPDAHQFAAWADNRSQDKLVTDKQRYINNVSYVDEYIGGVLTQLAIHFYDPSTIGFKPNKHETVICAYGTSPLAPLGSGGLIHQVRETKDGCEMRSRFWLGGPLKVYDLPTNIYENAIFANLLKIKPIEKVLTPLIQHNIAKSMPHNFFAIGNY